jgi:hypothetical protein
VVSVMMTRAMLDRSMSNCSSSYTPSCISHNSTPHNIIGYAIKHDVDRMLHWLASSSQQGCKKYRCLPPLV